MDKIKLNPELKKKWVDALRSGEYEQGVGALRTPDNKFCCLGVLCDVADNSMWHEVSSNVSDFGEHLGPHFEDLDLWDPDSYDFPSELEQTKFNALLEFGGKGWVYGRDEHAQWETIPNWIDLDGEDDELIAMNDSGKSFNDIADYIEENL